MLEFRFLLDANLSQKVGRFLAERFGVDVISLQGQRLGELPDREVIRMAQATGRVLITLDRDFAEYFYRTSEPQIGVIYLNLPNTHRTIPAINTVLERFFIAQVQSIDLDHSLVTITDRLVVIHHP